MNKNINFENLGFVGGFSPNFGIGGHGGGGGEYFDKNSYESANKNVNDGHFEKGSGSSGEAQNYGKEGYHHGNQGQKSAKDDSGFYKNYDAGKKAYEDGKSYSGSQHFNQEGFVCQKYNFH